MYWCLIPLVSLFREQGAAETRSFSTRGHAGLPNAEYALFEAYCPDPECDCRRVMLNVVGRRQGKRYFTSISFGFDHQVELAGPCRDEFNPQRELTQPLLLAVMKVLADPRLPYAPGIALSHGQAGHCQPAHPVPPILNR